MYQSKISDTKWIACDIPANLGWITFLVGMFLCWIRRPAMMENKGIAVLLFLDLFCGIVMITGLVELIRERLCKLDRVLPKRCLYRGFGALTFGGFSGMLVSLLAVAVSVLQGLDGTIYLALLSGGGFLCFLFSGLILKEYKRI